MTSAAEIGRRVRMVRVALGMSQGDLAQAVGMRQGPICNIEMGRNAPSVGTLARLCVALRCEPDVLLSGGAVVSAVVRQLRDDLDDARAERDAARAAAAASAAKLCQINEVLRS